jgi:ribosomal protein S7
MIVLYKFRKNRKKKYIKEIPTIITAKKVRISLAIKFILYDLKNKKLNCFYIKLYAEILSTVKNEGSAVQIKNEIQRSIQLSYKC